MKFKFLNLSSFESLLKTYSQIKTQLQELNQILIESTFLQIYASLEEALYLECEQQLVKKNASIIRFEPGLKEQGFDLKNEAWGRLIEIAKIRNGLIHGNGRLDEDKYGDDTRNTIDALNKDAGFIVIEIIDLNGSSKIKIKDELLNYFIAKIVKLIQTTSQS